MHVAWNMGIPWQETDTKDLEPLSFRRCIEMATINGARALGLDAVTGSLTPGKRADLIMLNTRDLNIAPVVDLESTIVRSATPANIDTVMIDGRILKRHRELVAFDVARVVQEAEQSSREVRARAGGRLQPEL
jgi:5-methylthioadenosine/S-adenosylhomocysteine deaminase